MPFMDLQRWQLHCDYYNMSNFRKVMFAVGLTAAAGVQTTTVICTTKKWIRPQGKYKEVIKSTACSVESYSEIGIYCRWLNNQMMCRYLFFRTALHGAVICKFHSWGRPFVISLERVHLYWLILSLFSLHVFVFSEMS